MGSDGLPYEKRVDKKGKVLSDTCIQDEVPFEIPNTWIWARLGDLITLLSGTDLKPSQYNDRKEGIPYITGASNFSSENIIENRWTTNATRISKKGQLLFTCKGTIGEMAINSFNEAHIARQVMAIIPFIQASQPFIAIFLKAVISYLKSNAKGVIPGIERATILNLLIPLPPLAE